MRVKHQKAFELYADFCYRPAVFYSDIKPVYVLRTLDYFFRNRGRVLKNKALTFSKIRTLGNSDMYLFYRLARQNISLQFEQRQTL